MSGDLFSNSANDPNCAILSCSLFDDSDCSIEFTGLSDDVGIETTPDLALSISKTNEAGYEYTVCLSCTNGVETKTIDRLRVS